MYLYLFIYFRYFIHISWASLHCALGLMEISITLLDNGLAEINKYIFNSLKGYTQKMTSIIFHSPCVISV